MTDRNTRMNTNLPALATLIHRRPELAGVGLGAWVQEVGA